MDDIFGLNTVFFSYFQRLIMWRQAFFVPGMSSIAGKQHAVLGFKEWITYVEMLRMLSQ